MSRAVTLADVIDEAARHGFTPDRIRIIARDGGPVSWDEVDVARDRQGGLTVGLVVEDEYDALADDDVDAVIEVQTAARELRNIAAELDDPAGDPVEIAERVRTVAANLESM